MPVQGALLNAQIPMSAKAIAPDIAGAVSKGTAIHDQVLASKEYERGLGQANNDRDALKLYIDSGGDMYTPEGAAKALVDLKGKVSSDSYMKLIGHVNKVKQEDIQYRSLISELDDQALKNHSTQLDKTLTYLAAPLKVYEDTAKTKGTQEADQAFQAARKQILESASKEMGPNGKPLYSPQVLQQLANATPEQLKGLMVGTTYQKNLLNQRVQESLISRNTGLTEFDRARAKAYEDGKIGAGGKSAIAKIEDDVAAGRLTPEQGKSMIDGIVAKTDKPADQSTLTPDAVERAAQDYYMFRELPARLGAAERSTILNRAAVIAKETGDTAEESTIRAAANKANKVALADVTKREALTAVFERDADKRLDLVQQLAKKADLSGSPALNRWIRAGRSNIAGDEDVNNLNSAMIALQAELAKVLSGALTNAGVSDAARAEAAQIINANMSPEMIDSLIPNIRKELKFKMDAFAEQKKAIRDSMRSENSGKEPTASGSHDKVDPKVQSARDSDAVSIMQKEYADKKALLDSIKDTDPDAEAKRRRAKSDIEDVTRELKRLGATPTAGPASTAAGKPDPAKPKGGSKDVPTKNARGWTLHIDKNGAKAYVSPDGKQFEPVVF